MGLSYSRALIDRLLFYLRNKLYIVFKNMPCELLEFSPHGISYFSFFKDIICCQIGIFISTFLLFPVPPFSDSLVFPKAVPDKH